MRVLVVEDEPQLRDELVTLLRHAGYAVDEAADGREAERLGLTEPYDAVVLDLGLPEIDGVSVLRRWREAERTMPVLVLTARSRWSDKLAGFNAGADDYLTKPFELDEVRLRIQALIRRSAGQASAVLTCGPVRLDTDTGRVTVNGVPLQLTAQEFRILAYLMYNQGRVVSRATLIDHVYDRSFNHDSNVVDVMLSRIRRKLSVSIIQTVRGQGYRLALPKA